MSEWTCTCGHIILNHTKEHPIWHGIEVCLERSGFLGLRRCPCFGFTPESD